MKKIFFAVFFVALFISKLGIAQDLEKLVEAYRLISYAYVDKVDEEKLTEDAIVAMLEKLDPHSVYMTKEEVIKANEPLKGNFVGIGVQFQILDDTINVVSPIPGGPSSQLGIMAGDKIVTIDGVPSEGDSINNQYVLDHLRGDKGSIVVVGVFRQGEDEIMHFDITRDDIPINSVDTYYMLTKEIGYIKISRFAMNTDKEFLTAIKALKKDGMKNLILDLRNNGGGYLKTAIEISDEFLKDNKLVVYTEGRVNPRNDYEATLKGSFEKGKLIVMVNEGSASASEIVSGAIQDWDRGIVVGRKTFGKGLVQTPVDLADGSAIRLTTARYYTPAGRCIQRPYGNSTEDYYENFLDRFEHGESFHRDSINFPDSLQYQTANGRIVYGGGGIMPDVFIPLDTNGTSVYYSKLWRKNLLSNYTLQYVNSNRAELTSKYTDIDQFIKKYVIDEEFLEGFIEYANNKGVEFEEEQYDISKELIINQLKALIARSIFDITASYIISSEIDNELQKAIGIMEDGDVFKENGINK